ncbi:outer membrane porin, OprD family [Pseudomonas sp. GM21]|uniref:OprD family porin n=1 Tax=Pseudomonas sp. GM21 TaxID=1144325 RepID=UPI000272354D|nr:OprD family porin [Pseudomonas sp. GM21]EJM22313.1 outer membrane porin, OprD family [Pseudomonas sp. GM21]
MKKSTLALAVTAVALAQQSIASGFVEDSKATLALRNFYINTDNRDSDAGTARAKANGVRSYLSEWGQGFDLRFTSGFTQGTVGFGIDAIGLLGVKLDSSEAKHGNPTGALSGGTVFPSQGNEAVDDFASLGLTAKAKISQTELRLGTLMPKNPVVMTNDGRLVTQTFQGGQVVSNDIKDLTLTAGQLEHAKGRNSTDEKGLSIAGANGGSDYSKATLSNKFYYGGADYKFTKNLTASYYHGELKNFYQQNFFGLVHNWSLGPGALKSDFRYYRSRDDGANGHDSAYYTSGYYPDNTSLTTRTKGKVDNDLYSALFLYSVEGHTFGGGYQYSDGDSDFPWLNQGDGASTSTINDIQIQKFLHAGERSWQARYFYDFAAVGAPGLTAGIVYVRGSDVDTVGKVGAAQTSTLGTGGNEWERDLSVSYVVQEGALKNLAFTWKNAMWRNDIPGQRDQDENRLIVSYSLPLF